MMTTKEMNDVMMNGNVMCMLKCYEQYEAPTPPPALLWGDDDDDEWYGEQ